MHGVLFRSDWNVAVKYRVPAAWQRIAAQAPLTLAQLHGRTQSPGRGSKDIRRKPYAIWNRLQGAGRFRGAKPPRFPSLCLHIATSIGICFFDGRESNIDLLLKQADSALYAAKRAGRNQYKAAGTLQA